MNNEFSVLMSALTRPGNPPGANISDLIEVLGYPVDPGRTIVFRLLAGLDRILHQVGLRIAFNPVEDVFFIDVTARGKEDRTRLPDRLAATLLAVIALSYRERDWVQVSQVRRVRRKTMRSVRADLRELQVLGYVEFSDDGTRVRPGIRVSFEVDHDEFFRALSKGKYGASSDE